MFEEVMAEKFLELLKELHQSSDLESTLVSISISIKKTPHVNIS